MHFMKSCLIFNALMQCLKMYGSIEKNKKLKLGYPRIQIINSFNLHFLENAHFRAENITLIV